MSNEISYVLLGGCADSTGGTRVSHDRCALTPDYCPTSDIFVSADQLVAGVNHPTCDGVPSATTGRCGDTGKCQAVAGGCKNPATFQTDNTCTVLQDTTSKTQLQQLFSNPNVPLTYYTGCRGPAVNPDVVFDTSGGDAFCVVTPQECRDMAQSQDLTVDVTTHDPVCDCANTRTGACIESGTFEYVCAVDASACNADTQTFVSAADLADLGETDCRLCSAQSVQGLQIAASSGNGTKFSTGEIVGITIGACFAFVLMVWMTCCTCRRCRGGGKKSPPKSIATNGASDVDDSETGGSGDVKAHGSEML